MRGKKRKFKTLKKLRNRKGFTLVEILACMLLLTVVIAMSFLVITFSSKTYAVAATRAQAEVFLSRNVAKVSHMMRYADMDFGILTSPEDDRHAALKGDVIPSKSQPVFLPRETDGYAGYFVNDDESGEIKFAYALDERDTAGNPITKVNDVCSNISDYKLRAEIVFSDDTDSDHFVFTVNIYADSFISSIMDPDNPRPICSAAQVVVPLEAEVL